MIPVSGSRLGLEDIGAFHSRQIVADAASARTEAQVKVSGKTELHDKNLPTLAASAMVYKRHSSDYLDSTKTKNFA